MNSIRRTSRSFWTSVALAAGLLVLQACSAYTPDPGLIGASSQQALASLGAPSMVQSTSMGQRLIYARGPQGHHTYFLEIDAASRVMEIRQVLNDAQFAQVTPGMSSAQVQALIGPSYEKTQLARGRGSLWSYRFENPFCLWFQVEFSEEGLVRTAGHGIPPECGQLEDRSGP